MISPPDPHLPLAGKSAVLVCSPLKAEALETGLEAMGAKVRLFQAIAVRPVDDTAALDVALACLPAYSWIIFTSAHAVIFFARRMRELAVPSEKLDRVGICAVGPATAKKAEECGLRVSLVPHDFVAEGVLEALAQRLGDVRLLAGRKILIPRAKEARNVLPEALSAAGAVVDIAVCYETVQAEADPAAVAEVRAHPPDLIVFTSSSNVASFASLVGVRDLTGLLAAATIAVLGPVTAKTVESFGKRPEILPLQNTIPSLLECIRAHYLRS